MTPRQLLEALRSRGIELELSPDSRRFRPRCPIDEETLELLRRNRLWLLMLLLHDAGGDLYDPRLAFIASAEHGLTRGAIATRMEIAFGLTRELAEQLIELAEEAGYLRCEGEVYHPVGDVAAALTDRREVLPA